MRDGCDQVHMDLWNEMTDHRKVKSLSHTGHFHPLCDPSNPYQVDHDDIDRSCLEHMTKRSNTIVVLSCSDRRSQGVSDTGQPLVVVVRYHILEPEQMVWLNSATNVNRLVHRPELVDIAHQVNILADALTQHTHAFDFAVNGRLGTHLRLHLPKPRLYQTGTGLGQIRCGVRTHQSTARVGWGTVTIAPEQSVYRLPERLAFDVPQGNING